MCVREYSSYTNMHTNHTRPLTQISIYGVMNTNTAVQMYWIVFSFFFAFSILSGRLAFYTLYMCDGITCSVSNTYVLQLCSSDTKGILGCCISCLCMRVLMFAVLYFSIHSFRTGPAPVLCHCQKYAAYQN